MPMKLQVLSFRTCIVSLSVATLSVRRKDFEPLGTLGLRVKGAYGGAVTEAGPLVSDRYILFHQGFVQGSAQALAERLAEQNGHPLLRTQAEARARLRQAQEAATCKGQLLGHLAATPALRVKAEQVAGIRFRARRSDPWRYVWLDAYRLRLFAALYKAPLGFFCAAWDAPVVLRRGARTVGCIMPASPCPLDIEVRR